MNKELPLISVIVPNYNHEDYLKQRLESIFNQTYGNFEVILLDDKSTDNSAEIIKSYNTHSKVSHCIFNEENSGSTFKQWNKGVELAKGDYIWIAETDDFCETHFLENVIAPFFKDKEIALTYCQSHRVNSRGVVTGNWISHTAKFKNNPFQNDFIMDGNLFIERFLIHKNVIPNAGAVIIKKSILKKILPLDFKPYLKYTADWLYYAQLICNEKVAFISESMNYFRFHEKSVIAKADAESGLPKILEMEIKMKSDMFKFIEHQNPKNLIALKNGYKNEKERLIYKRASVLIEQRKYFSAICGVFFSRRLLKKR